MKLSEVGPGMRIIYHGVLSPVEGGPVVVVVGVERYGYLHHAKGYLCGRVADPHGTDYPVGAWFIGHCRDFGDEP